MPATPTFTHLAEFTLSSSKPLSRPSSAAAKRVRASDAAVHPDSPLLNARSDSTWSFESVESVDEAPTPPQSPEQARQVRTMDGTPVFAYDVSRQLAALDLESPKIESYRVELSPPSRTDAIPIALETPAQTSPVFGLQIQDSPEQQHRPKMANPTPPSHTRSYSVPDATAAQPCANPTASPSPSRRKRNLTSPDMMGLAARRAAAGSLPNNSLHLLQQMRFESVNAGAGLGVGPGSAGRTPTLTDDSGNSTPQQPQQRQQYCETDTGTAFTLALAFDPAQQAADDAVSASPRHGSSPAPTSPVLKTPVNQSPARRRLLGLVSGHPGATSPDAVKIPPSLRGSKLLDTINLSTPPPSNGTLSPGRERPGYAASPPSPLIVRSSAYSYFASPSSTGPLTPLTPSHMPSAPSLSSDSSQFDWHPFSLPSPGCPAAPVKSVFEGDDGVEPNNAFFLSAPQQNDFFSNVSAARLSRSRLPSSPLSSAAHENYAARTASQNPFFFHT